MGEKQGKISVVVPVHNVEAYVEKCLASLAAQTYPDMEVIVVDDASTDGGGAICAAWAARDSRFQVLRLPENQGLSAARNAGVRRAAGDYVAFVDSARVLAPAEELALWAGTPVFQAMAALYRQRKRVQRSRTE